MIVVPSCLKRGLKRIKQGSIGLADTVPVYAQISHHSAWLAGESSIKFFTDAETFLRCELTADELYSIDAPTIHYDLYNIEAEALGASLIWQEGQIPAFNPQQSLLQRPDDFVSLKPTKMGAEARMPYVIEINRRLVDMGLEPKVRFTGLFTLAANLLGLQNLILWIMSDPDSVHRLMRFLTDEVVAPWILYQRERCGSEVTATGSDALASPPICSPQIVREFCLHYILELERMIGGIRLAGLFGESCLMKPQELLDIKREGCASSIQVLDPDVSKLGPTYFSNYARRYGIPLVMGVDAHLIGTGPIAEIQSRVRWFIEKAGRWGRFILFINDIPYDTPPEHIKAAVAAAREYRVRSGDDEYSGIDLDR